MNLKKILDSEKIVNKALPSVNGKNTPSKSGDGYDWGPVGKGKGFVAPLKECDIEIKGKKPFVAMFAKNYKTTNKAIMYFPDGLFTKPKLIRIDLNNVYEESIIMFIKRYWGDSCPSDLGTNIFQTKPTTIDGVQIEWFIGDKIVE